MNRCNLCGKALRSRNKSGFCSICQSKKVIQLTPEDLNKLKYYSALNKLRDKANG